MDARTDQLPLGTGTLPAEEKPLAQAGPPEPERDFDWSPENPDIGWADQPATALYLNQWGQVVIRQQGEWNDDSDPVVRVSLHHVRSLIDRLQAIMREQ